MALLRQKYTHASVCIFPIVLISSRPHNCLINLDIIIHHSKDPDQNQPNHQPILLPPPSSSISWLHTVWLWYIVNTSWLSLLFLCLFIIMIAIIITIIIPIDSHPRDCSCSADASRWPEGGYLPSLGRWTGFPWFEKKKGWLDGFKKSPTGPTWTEP